MSSGGDGKSKYRDRYAVLQKTYEQRLQSLGELFQKALGEIHADESLAILKQDNVSNDFVTLRVHELVAHALCDEKEHFIRTLTDKLARKEASLKELLRDKETMATQKKALMDELHHVATHVEALQARYTAMSTDTNATDAEVHRLRHENQELIEQLAARDADRAAWDDERRAFSTVQQDLVRLQAEHAKDAAFYTEERSKAAKTIDLLTAKVDDLESNRTKLSADCTALSLAAQEKAIELAHAKDTIDSLRRQCGALQPLEGQMADLKATHQAQVHALEMDLWEARRKYSAVGEQVEGLIHDHDQERALLVESHEKERTAAANELRQRDERSKDLLDASAKQIASLEGQIKERDGVLRDTLQQLEEMEARAAASDVGRGELKVQMTKRVAALEGEVAAVAKEGLAALEKEQQARASVEDQFGAYKRMSELKVQSLMAALQAQKDATKRHEDAEKRMQWQDAAMKKHDALLQAMKSKYETAIAALQTEVVAAQSKAAEAATEFHHKSTRHELNLMQQYQSKVAEAAKQLPGQVVSMTEHKAELDKLEAKLTLQLQTLHRQDQVQWEEAHRHVMDEKVQALEAQLDTWKAQVAVEKQKGDELHAALLAERKHVLDCRAAIDDESIAKTVVVQRLEEANVNLGRLKALVHDQRSALRQWEDKFSSLRSELETAQGDATKLTTDLDRSQSEAAELRDAVTRHVSTIQQLQQDGRAAHSVAAEREAALQALLKDKADAIAYLQELVRQAEEKHAVATKQTQIDMASKEDSWATQAVDLHARIDALSADNQHHTVENARLIESIKDHAATIRQVQNDLDQTRGDLAAMQRKKHQYKAALIAQKQSMAAAVHAQDEWKHEVVVHETTRMHEWKSTVDAVQSQVRALKGEFAAVQLHIRRLLEQDVVQSRQVAQQVETKARGMIQTLLANAAQHVADAKAQWAMDKASHLARLSNEHVAELAAQRHTLESEFRKQLDAHQETTAQTHAELTTLISERDTKLEAITGVVHRHIITIQSLEQRLEFQQDGGAKEIEQVRRQLLETTHDVAAKQARVATLETDLSRAHSELARAKQVATGLCDAMARISQAVAKPGQTKPFPDWDSDMASGECWPRGWKKAVHSWIDDTLAAIATSQDNAIASAVQPFKDELQRAPQVLGRKDSGDVSKSVLAMAAPVAEELGVAKHTIARLTDECSRLQTELSAAKQQRDDLHRRCSQLADDKVELETFLDLAGQDRKAAQAQFSTQLQEAYVQSEEALHQAKTAAAHEMERIQRECRQAVHDLQDEVDYQTRQHAKLRASAAEQENKWKGEIQDLVRRNHALVKCTREESLPRTGPSTDVDRVLRQHPYDPRIDHRRTSTTPTMTSMRDLSILMETNLEASRHASRQRRRDRD